MASSGRSGEQENAVALVAPTRARAEAAAERLQGLWNGNPLAAASLAAALAGPVRPRVLLCPLGRSLDGDLAFLRRVRQRLLWPAPGEGLRAAIAGLRGEHPGGTGKSSRRRGPGRHSALLLEGTVTPGRARKALASANRDWIVEDPFSVRLTDRQLRELARHGVTWFVLEPVVVEALLASPALARARDRWRNLLPRGTRVLPWKPGRDAS